MLSFDTVHLLTGCLLQAQSDTPHGPVAADLLGTLVLAQDRPVDPTGSQPWYLRVLQMPLSSDRGGHLSLPAALQQIADGLPGHDPSLARMSPAGGRHSGDLDMLRAALCQPGLRLLAWAISYDDLRVHDEDVVMVRRVDAVDVDGRVYQLSLHAGEAHPVVLLDEQPDPGDLPATGPTGHCRAAGADLSPANGRYSATTTRTGLAAPARSPNAVPGSTTRWNETRGRMPMLAEVVDAVIGIDTHRDSHAVGDRGHDRVADPDHADRQRQQGFRASAGADR